jgi:hypothetical protein
MFGSRRLATGFWQEDIVKYHFEEPDRREEFVVGVGGYYLGRWINQ